MSGEISHRKLDIYDPRPCMNPLKVEYFLRNCRYLNIHIIVSPALDWFNNFPQQYAVIY